MCAQLPWDTMLCEYKGVKVLTSIPLTKCFVSGILLGFPNQVHFSARFLHSVDHLSCYVCSAALGQDNIKV